MTDLTDVLGGRFTPPREERKDPPEIQLADAIRAHGMEPPEAIHLDGQLHRFSPTGKKSDDAGWYVAFGDGVPAGIFGNWRDGDSIPWRADIGRTLTPAEEMAHAQRMAKAKEQRRQATEQKQEAAAATAADIWQQATPASDDHPYLQRKGVKAHGLRVTGDGRLIAPMYAGGGISSLQYIDSDGGKRFHPGGKVGGAYLTVGDPGAGRVYLCEGVATAYTVHEVTGHAAAAAFSAGNMAAVARTLRERYPTTAIVVVADNDESGTGQREAQKAADAIGSRLVVPPEIGDANDYHLAGHDLAALLEPPRTDWLVSADDFCSEPAPISWLIKHHIQRQALHMVHGPSGSGKTFVVLDMALSMASAQPAWCGHRVTSEPVVYLAGEGHHGLRSRLAAWKKHHNAGHLNMWLSRAGLDLNTPEGYATTCEALRALPERPGLVIVDTLHRFLKGDENSAQDAKTMLDACAAIMDEFGCAVLLVHHTGVDEGAQHRARGSSAWRGALDIEFSVAPGGEGQPIELIQRKAKDSEMVQPTYMELVSVGLDWQDEDGEPVTSAVAVKTDAPIKVKDSAALKQAKQIFEGAFLKYGEVLDGAPYVSESALREHVKQETGKAGSTLRSRYKRIVDNLVENSVIDQKLNGFSVAMTEFAAPLLILKKG